MQVTLGNTIGAGLLGCMASSILFGIAVVQTFIYYKHYPKDWAFQKTVVGFLLLVDVVHTGMTTHTVYYYVIEQFGDFFALELVVWSFKLQVLFNVVILLIVQSLYVLRIWKLGSHFSRVWPVIIIVIQAGGYVIGILLVIRTYGLQSWAGLPAMSSVVQASLSFSTGIDIILAASMCYYLNKSKSSFTGTNSRIVAVIHYVLISGSLTSATSLTILVCYITMPNNLIFIGITFLVTKVYINSYLAMLNARNSVREDTSSQDVGRIMSLHSVGTNPPNPASVDHDGDKLHSDSLELSSVRYRQAGLEEDLARSAKSKPGLAQFGRIGIQIHRTEERRIEDGSGYWSPV